MKRWTIDRVGFVLGHLENFVERAGEDDQLREQLRAFAPRTDLAEVERITLADPGDPKLPELVLERLAPYFDAGVLIQRELEEDAWEVTELSGRGALFHLSREERIVANRVVPELGPLDVRRGPAKSVLKLLGLECLLPAPDAEAYLIRPTPTVCLLLITRLAAVFAPDQIGAAHRLVHESFVF